MQLDLDLGVLLHHLMEGLGMQGEHVAVGQRPCCEDGGEQLLVVAYVLCCVPTHLRTGASAWHSVLVEARLTQGNQLLQFLQSCCDA